jgi:alanine or glycine:cation symporter, AGCS family
VVLGRSVTTCRLTRSRAAPPYRLLWLVCIYLGAVGSLQLVWSASDTLDGLMAIPNLVSVLISLPLLRRLHQEYFASRTARA